MSTQKIKKFYQAKFDIAMKDLSEKVKLVIEKNKILLEVKSESIEDFETAINKKSGFVNSMMSATAYGLEKQFKRLLEIEKILDGKLTANDINQDNSIKRAVIDKLRDEHTEYFSKKEIALKKQLDKVLQLYNEIESEDRKHIGLSRDGSLVYSPFSVLRGNL